MATFYKGLNNSVVAVVTEDTRQRMQEQEELLAQCEQKGLGRPQLPRIGPVFTFADEDHPSFQHMTGSIKTMKMLLEGHKVQHVGLWVPFSNGYEWGWNDTEDGEQARWELGFLTSLDAAIKAFGLVRAPADESSS